MKKVMLLTVLFTFLVSTAFAAEDSFKDPFDETVTVAEYMEPAIPHPDQEEEAASKLEKLEAEYGRKPNILIFLVDDMGWGDPGVYGGGEAVGAPTPVMDKMAMQGLKLTSTYSQPTCTPTRAAMYTGRLPLRSGLTRPILTGENPTVNPWASEDTAAKLLSEVGYRTALSGKWHLGEMEGTQPHQVGFDEFYGIFAAASEYDQFMDERLYPELVTNKERLEKAKSLSTSAIEKGSKGGPTEIAKELNSLDDIAEMDQDFKRWSKEFIRETVADEKPFYLVHAFSRVHNDNYPAEGYAGKSPAGIPYKDGVVEVDDIIGEIMAVVEELGQLENTFVFITSDNGANEDTWPDSGHQPWRGGKGTTWEGGVRVPGIAYWPGMIEAGRVSDGLFDLLDLFNTSLSLGGAEDLISSERYIDGIDQASFLLSDNGESNRQTVFMYSEQNFCAVRWEEFKVHFKVFQTLQARQNIDESNLISVGMSPWVYNLYSDPKEQRSSGHRSFEWGLPRVLSMVNKQLATVVKYPPKDIGLGVPGK